jgi:transcriptional regulator with XRE-family HTH domain
VVRRRIEERTDLSLQTLGRWASGQTKEPDRKRLMQLLHALPQHRDRLLSTLTTALPDVAVPLLDPRNRLAEDLPVEFWIRLVETHATTPTHLHFHAVVDLE